MMICDLCKCKGHNKEFFYRVVGYPPDFKSKRKIQGASSESSGQAHFLMEVIMMYLHQDGRETSHSTTSYLTW